jgi:hypothetical protein
MSNTSAIEEDGITALRNFISQSKIIRPMVREGDKEISWDGFLYVFETANHKKDNLHGRIPVQVKSAKRFPKGNETYSIEKSHLTNYLNDGGILFIRPIFRTTTNYEIYIRILLPVTIKELLAQSKTASQSIPITFEKINDIKLFEAKCLHFLENAPLQRNIENSITINNFPVKEFELEAKTILHGNKVFESLVSDDCHFYAKLKEGVIIPIPDFPKDSLEFTRESKISVNSITYFESVTFFNLREKDTVSCKFGNYLEFQFKTGLVHFNYTCKEFGLFAERLKTLRFLVEMNKNKSFELDGIKVNLNDSYNDNFTLIQDELNFYEDINQFFTLFRFESNKITLEEINKDLPEIRKLIQFCVKKEKIPTQNRKQLGIKQSEVCKKILIIIFKNVDNQFYEAINFFEDGFDLFWESVQITNLDGISVPGSRFLILNNKVLVQSIVGYFEEVRKDLLVRYNEKLSSVYENFMLSCIHSYDSTNKIEFLSLANLINNKINEGNIEEQSNAIYIINQYQIIKRQRELREEEKKILFNLKTKTSELQVLCCINILLNSFEEFKIVFDILDDTSKLRFKSWPIWNLYPSELKLKIQEQA